MSEISLNVISGAVVDTDAIEIGALYERSNSSLADSVLARVECGRLLAEKKATMKHGKWLLWLDDNAGVLGFSTRKTAAQLMKAAQANVTLALHLDQPAALAISRQMWGHEIKEVAKELRAEEQVVKRAARDKNLITLSSSNSPLPQDRLYPVIYADPAWEYDFSPSSARAVENHYPTMPIEEILALEVETLATKDAILFLWAPPSFIKKGIAVLEAWGFELASSMVWDKEKIGTGIYFRQQHEYLLLGKRGKPITPAPGTQPRSVHREARGKHSEKPEYFYDMIEQMYPGLPKIELFSRGAPDGWAVWGNESGE